MLNEIILHFTLVVLICIMNFYKNNTIVYAYMKFDKAQIIVLFNISGWNYISKKYQKLMSYHFALVIAGKYPM
jgi:hypothetical protein